MEYLRPGGTLVAVGLPGRATLSASIFSTVCKNINIVGSYVGNRQDAIEALALAAEGKVKVHYAKKSLSELDQTFQALEEGKIAGRVVLDIPQ